MVIDLHNDILTSRLTAVRINEELKKNETEGIKPIYAVYTTELKSPLTFFETARKFAPDAMLAIEDMSFATEDNLEKIVGLAPVYCGLTWNHDNSLAGGALQDGELTDWGKSVIKTLEENKIRIDTAHLNRKSFWQLMELNPVGVFCTHTAIDFVNSHLRNLTKEQICAILLCGGIVGIAFVSHFLCEVGNARLKNLCDHIIAFLDTFGDNGLALGTDFYGTEHGVEGIKDYCDLIALRGELLKRGIGEKTIDKIFYLNAARFLEYE